MSFVKTNTWFTYIRSIDVTGKQRWTYICTVCKLLDIDTISKMSFISETQKKYSWKTENTVDLDFVVSVH